MVTKNDMSTYHQIHPVEQKYFRKELYAVGDIVIWMNGCDIAGTGSVVEVNGDLCTVNDEAGQRNIQSHRQFYLHESTLMNTIIHDMVLMKKEIHNLQTENKILSRWMVESNKMIIDYDTRLKNVYLNTDAPQFIQSKL